jgi:hypothetical protein
LSRYDTSRKVTGSIPDEIIGFFNLHNLSSRTVALGSTQPLTEMSTRNLLGGKGRPVRKAHNLTATCEPIVWEIRAPQRLITLWVFTAGYRDNFSFYHTIFRANETSVKEGECAGLVTLES